MSDFVPCTPEYLVQESGLWWSSEEEWNQLRTLALNYLDIDPMATPSDFAYFVTTTYLT